MTDAFIYDAVRSPRGKGRPDGSLHVGRAHPVQLEQGRSIAQGSAASDYLRDFDSRRLRRACSLAWASAFSASSKRSNAR